MYARFDVCLSWDTQSGTVLMNFCKYKKSPPSTAIDRVFFKMSDNPHNLSYDECELNNREGMFCSRCKQGFAHSIHIFRGKCTSCSQCFQTPASLFLFLVSEIVPLTVFYLTIVGLRVNIVSGPILGYVLFCQAHISTIHTYPLTWKFLLSQSGKFVMYWNTYILIPLAGIWNLNFFSMYILNLCYGCHFNDLSGILMQYLSVVYIFVLIFLSYIFSKPTVKAKIVSCRVCKNILFMWTRWRKNWSFGDSTIHAFATFSALLVVKVGIISLQIVKSRKVYNVNGTTIKEVVTFEPSIEALSHQHAPYIFAAYFPVGLFLIMPALLLCLYPNRHFQSMLVRCCGPRKRLALAIFVDTISSGYRDGLDGGRDWRRLFPASLLTFAGLLFSSMLITYHNITVLSDSFFIILVPFLLLFSFFILCINPCKSKEMNISLSFHINILALSLFSVGLWIQDYYLNARILEIFLSVCLSLPHVVMLLWLLRHIVTRCQSLRNCCLKIRCGRILYSSVG